MRTRALIVVVLLLSYGAVGARQPAVRMDVPLPAPAQELAAALQISSLDRSQLVLTIVRSVYGITQADSRTTASQNFLALLTNGTPSRSEQVPLPLDASIWRETILHRDVPDDRILAAILSTRETALMYHGLAGLDDETLAWLGAERDTIQFVQKRPGAFAIFGPSVRVHAGKVAVPGGPENDALWEAIVGAAPAKPAQFVRRLFGSSSSHLAWFYDSVAQLDDARVRLALASSLTGSARVDRVRALVGVFEFVAEHWQPDVLPFSRKPLDPFTSLRALAVTEDGTLEGPVSRELWETVFSDDGRGASPRSPAAAPAVDVAWLLSRIHRAPVDVSRRRLNAVLFAQRVFDADGDRRQAEIISRSIAYPALMLTLERAGLTDPAMLAAAGARADAIERVGDMRGRRILLGQYQSLVGIIERMRLREGITVDRATALVGSLSRIDTGANDPDAKVAAWIRKELLPSLGAVPQETADANEDRVLAAMAGALDGDGGPRIVEWEGRQYRVSAGRGELQRLRRVRQRQRGLSVTAALVAAEQPGPAGEQELADTLMSILYAAHLGDPDGPALATTNIALKHEFGHNLFTGARGAWKLPLEGQSPDGWRVAGSLLGLDVALARLALRRLDATGPPQEPRLVSSERQTAALTVALANPRRLTDASRDEIAAALGRGRARLAALDADRTAIEAVARDAGLSAWRREALAWTAANDREHLLDQLSPVEIMWLGKPRASAALSLEGWGAAMLPLTGCICLAMPRPAPWEGLTGRPALGMLGTRGADVPILVAELLSSMQLPAEIAPGVMAFAMQQVVDAAQPSYYDDWPGVIRAATSISRDAFVDYIAAQAANGSLVPDRRASTRQH